MLRSPGPRAVLAERRVVLDAPERVIAPRPPLLKVVLALIVVCALTVALMTWAAALRLARADLGRAEAMEELTYLRPISSGWCRSARCNTALEAMDNAIRELRASIFEVGGRGELDADLTTDVDDVCGESAGILGFRPDVTVDDPDWDAADARDDILAVLREALANVARHADTSHGDVVLRCCEGVVELSVTDDGGGMAETLTRRSRIRNMRDRARRRGGVRVI